MNIYSILSSKPHNSHYLNRYITFIQKCQHINSDRKLSKWTNTNTDGSYMEAHHILPKSNDMFPEYSSFSDYPWNRVNLTARQHYIAHWILYKTYGKSQTISFFRMCNYKRSYKRGERNISSKVYENLRSLNSIEMSNRLTGVTSDLKKETSRRNFAIASERNRGKKRPDHSELMKQRYKEGKLLHNKIHPMLGKKHKEESKKKLSDSTKNRIKAVSCIKCHKPKNAGEVHDGIWLCHYYNHHKDCSI